MLEFSRVKNMKQSKMASITERAVRKTMPLTLRQKLKAMEHRVGKYPQFVVLSTARAGSTYTAQLLRQVGLRCSHEMFFTPSGFYKSLRYDGDASWLAVPYLEHDKSLTTNVIHQVRNPLDVVSSLYGIGFFKFSNENPFARFVRQNFSTTGDELLDCVKFWTSWNKRCEVLASQTFFFENILVDPLPLLKQLGVAPPSTHKGHEKLTSLASKKVNSRKRIEITLGDIPEGRHKKDMLFLAEKYGYHLS
jgi:hypothetical protein